MRGRGSERRGEALRSGPRKGGEGKGGEALCGRLGGILLECGCGHKGERTRRPTRARKSWEVHERLLIRVEAANRARAESFRNGRAFERKDELSKHPKLYHFTTANNRCTIDPWTAPKRPQRFVWRAIPSEADSVHPMLPKYRWASKSKTGEPALLRDTGRPASAPRSSTGPPGDRQSNARSANLLSLLKAAAAAWTSFARATPQVHPVTRSPGRQA